jgi:hypothetical protein
MKKLVSFVAIACVLVTALNAQTIVPTTPSNRNVILEEYTGIHCGYCPDGHKRANQLMAANPNRAWAINIHQGSYANPGTGEPDFRTPWGNALAGQTGLTGYPSGTINRQAFTTSTATALDRGNWANRASQVLAQPSSVNVAATASIDFNTRELVVNVEVYYTSNSTTATNYLNVALLQDNIWGPQSGASDFYPEMMEDGLYRHNHMLRHLLTGQWGDEITTTTTGSFVSRQYTYTVPAHLNNVEYVLEDLQVIVFIAECHQYITTGNTAAITLSNFTPRFVNVKEKHLFNCNEVQFYTTIKNLWDGQDITSADFDYSYGGNTYTFSWNNRTIGSMQSDTIVFPPIAVTSGIEVPITVTLTALNGAPYAGGSKVITLSKNKYDTHKNPTLKLYTDRFASETNVYLYNSAGQLILSEGPWSDLSGTGITEHIIPLPMGEADCYNLVITDAYGDGVNGGYGAGHVDIVSSTGTMIVSNDGKFGKRLDLFFDCDGLSDAKGNVESNSNLSTNNNVVFAANFDKSNSDENGVCKLTTEEIQMLNNGPKGYNCATSINNIDYVNFTIYPNPITETLIIQTDIAIERVEIYNMLGQLVQSESNTKNVNVSKLSAGLYTVKVTTDAGVKVQKVVKK